MSRPRRSVNPGKILGDVAADVLSVVDAGDDDVRGLGQGLQHVQQRVGGFSGYGRSRIAGRRGACGDAERAGGECTVVPL